MALHSNPKVQQQQNQKRNEMFETAIFLDGMEKLVERCHQISKNKGFWTGPENDNIPTKLMLIVSEVSEWLEAHRADPKAPCGKMVRIEDDNGPRMVPLSIVRKTRGMGPVTKEEEEAADILIRLCDLCGRQDIDLGRVTLAKMRYNASREHMHGGKKI